ncbi:MAG: hypothetical protein ACRDD1_00950 [Planctomycetia bacterium]
MTKKAKWTAVAAAGAVVLALAVWWLAAGAQSAVQMAKVEAIAQKVFTSEPAAVPEEERMRLFVELKSEAGKLTEDQRVELFRKNNPMKKTTDAYFELPQDERRKFLDKMIKDSEARAKEFEKNGGMRKDGGPFGGDAKKKAEFMRKMLDRTTPEERTKFQEFAKAMRDRRVELGLPAEGPPPFGPPGIR